MSGQGTWLTLEISKQLRGMIQAEQAKRRRWGTESINWTLGWQPSWSIVPSWRRICICLKVFFGHNSSMLTRGFTSSKSAGIDLVLPYAEILCDTVWHRVYPPLRDKIITKCTRQSPQTGYLLWHPSIRSSPCTDTSEGKTGQNFRGMSEWPIKTSAQEAQQGSTWLNSTFMMEGFERQEAKTLHLFSSYLRNALYKPLFSHFFCCRIPRLQDSADMPRFRNLMCELNPVLYNEEICYAGKERSGCWFQPEVLECPVLWPHLEVPIQYNASVPPCTVQYVIVIKATTAPEHQRLEQSIKRHYQKNTALRCAQTKQIHA